MGSQTYKRNIAMSKPFTHLGKRLFPQSQTFLNQLNPGDQFQIKHSPEVYTVQKDGLPTDEKGETKFLPSQMPVVPLKAF